MPGATFGLPLHSHLIYLGGLFHFKEDANDKSRD